MPAATAAPRNPRWNGWISSGEKRRTLRRSIDLANRGAQLLAGPSRAARCRPSIVVAPPSGKQSAAVVRGASSDHPGTFEGQLLTSRALSPVPPIVCLRKRPRIKKLLRPAAKAIAAVVGPRLNDGDPQSGLDEPSCHYRAGRPAPDNDYVAGARSFDHSEL